MQATGGSSSSEADGEASRARESGVSAVVDDLGHSAGSRGNKLNEGDNKGDNEDSAKKSPLRLHQQSLDRLLSSSAGQDAWLDSDTVLSFLEWATNYRPDWRVSDSRSTACLAAHPPLHWQNATGSILVPLNPTNNHWLLCVLDMQATTITLYDSMPSTPYTEPDPRRC